MFEYMDAEKHGKDAFTVMARAITSHYNNDEKKVPPAMARIMAKIIDDGFLDGVIEEQAKLIAHSKKILSRTEDQVRKEERRLYIALREFDDVTGKIKSLNRYLEERKLAELEEKDPMLSGARKAYLFIMKETNDKEKACKAYNSYLQGLGKYKQYETEKAAQS